MIAKERKTKIMNQFELGILDFIWKNLHNALFDVVLPIITHLGDAGIFWIALALVFIIIKKTRPLGVAMGIALILDLLCCNLILKPIVHRIRPYTLNPDMLDKIKALIHADPPSDYSFPSGHTAASFASCCALLFKKNFKFGIPATIIAILIAFSRLYLYIHFPTDVLGGIVVGIVVGFLGALLCGMLEKYLKEKKNITL